LVNAGSPDGLGAAPSLLAARAFWRRASALALWMRAASRAISSASRLAASSSARAARRACSTAPASCWMTS